MAAPVRRGNLSEEAVRSLLEATEPGKLASIFFTPPAAEGAAPITALAFVIRCRPGGFMVCLPAEEQVQTALDAAPLRYAHQLCMITIGANRGRNTAEVEAVLVDSAWDALEDFSKVTALRGEAAKALVKFKLGASGAAPMLDSVIAASDAWIAEAMAEETAAEYFTGDEFADPAIDGEPLADGAVDAGVVDQLQNRVLELEAQLAAAAVHPPRPPTPGTLGGGLLAGGPRAPAAVPNVLDRMRALAGAGPPKTAAHERALASSHALPQVGALQEEQLEVVEEDDMEQALEEAMAASTDPVHKLLALQMRQVQLLTKQLQAKQSSDPIQSLLSGSDGGSSGGGGTSIKGCLAREAYVKIPADLVKMATVGEQNAALDLGLQTTQVTPGLLQDYLERRIPLGDHRLLTQFGYIMSHAFEAGARSGNRELQGFAVKGMMFVEQASLDGGKTGLAWLLLGIPEPNYAVVARNRVRTSLQPWTRLASPSWVAANVSYLKDMDVMESRILQTGKAKDSKEPRPQEGEPKGNPNAKKKAKGKGKGELAQPTGETVA